MSNTQVSPAGTVLGVGIATLDIINQVQVYPAEDAEVRALDQRQVRGGNTTNSLVVLSQLGRPCAWAGTLGDDPASDLILADLRRHAVDTSLSVRHPGGQTPTSYIALSQATGSRTIVHHRDLAELTADDLAHGLSAHTDRWRRDCAWVHFEGRNPGETLAMMHLIRERLPGVTISLEMEKLRPSGDQLLNWPDLLLFSRAYALALGASNPEKFLAEQAERSRARHCVLAWGALGSYGWTRGGPVLHAMPQAPQRLVDTLGAGDVFNAAVIDGLLRGQALPETLTRANRLAGIKCGLQGMSGLILAATAAGFR